MGQLLATMGRACSTPLPMKPGFGLHTAAHSAIARRARCGNTLSLIVPLDRVQQSLRCQEWRNPHRNHEVLPVDEVILQRLRFDAEALGGDPFGLEHLF